MKMKAKTYQIVPILLTLFLIFSVTLVMASSNKQIKIFKPSKSLIGEHQTTIGFSPDRVIAPTTSTIDRLIFKLKGCTILHNLNDATALKCPKGVSIANSRPDRIFHSHDLEADVQINADDVWAIGYDGSGVKMAILDTGVDDSHIELSDSVVAKRNFVRGPGSDKHGHGTHVSGIVTANGVYQIQGNYATGVAPGADIIVGKVCGFSGCPESSIMAGIEWAVAQDADVLTLSLGGGNFGGHCDSDPLAAKLNWAVSQGLIVTVSSGNDGAGVSSPACASGAIAVGATDKSDVRPGWSNFGSALDIVAPGVNILSTYSCDAAGDCGSYWYAWMSGTSMSAPHVAGTAALILQKNPSYTVDDVKNALYNSAVDFGDAGYDVYYGHGRVDALGAVNYNAISPTTTTTTSTTTSTTATTSTSTTTSTTTTLGSEPERGKKKCNDGIDNDRDGFTDSDDPDCSRWT
jgi:subtilisin family serine protease